MSVEWWGVEQGQNLSESTQRGPLDSTNKAPGKTSMALSPKVVCGGACGVFNPLHRDHLKAPNF